MKTKTKEEILIEDIPYGQIEPIKKGIVDNLEGIYDPYHVQEWQYDFYKNGQKIGEQIQSILNHCETPKNISQR